ncbi:hypothetical protein ACH46L_31660 [Streptomyces althioticus]|uniref:hypothetical protein n=1 Tax=Streptomyces althioticus TaxID=83380 RepID=UPI0037A6B1F0
MTRNHHGRLLLHAHACVLAHRCALVEQLPVPHPWYAADPQQRPPRRPRRFRGTRPAPAARVPAGPPLADLVPVDEHDEAVDLAVDVAHYVRQFNTAAHVRRYGAPCPHDRPSLLVQLRADLVTVRDLDATVGEWTTAVARVLEAAALYRMPPATPAALRRIAARALAGWLADAPPVVRPVVLRTPHRVVEARTMGKKRTSGIR